MQKIIPFLWFDQQAEEAVRLYTSVFKDSAIESITRYGKESAGASGKDEGTVMTAAFRLGGQEFAAINGGPHFHFNPSISFFVTLGSEEEVLSVWERLSKDGAVLMEMGEYPWSSKYGWLQDKYGVSWQIALGGRSDAGQAIVPFLMFTGSQCGRAEEALRFYTSLFNDSSVEEITHYSAGEGEIEGNVKNAHFRIGGRTFTVMDSSYDHAFGFNESISFVINCDDQAEVDYFWQKLTEGGEESQCAWLKDRYGISWQIVPKALPRLLGDKDRVKAERVTRAMLQMKKIDIAELERAYNGE